MIVQADVVIADPEHMLARLDHALSGEIIGAFLKGPVQDFFAEEAAWRFGAEGDKASGGWPPLSDATVDIRERLGFSSDEPNIRTNDMFNFVTESSDLVMGPGFAQITIPGTPSDPLMAQKIETAQRGRADNPIPGFGPTPPRPVIATSGEEDLREVIYLLAKHVTQWMAGVGVTVA